MQHKKAVVAQLLSLVSPTQVWNLGANAGYFSRLVSNRGIFTAAIDFDPAAVGFTWNANANNMKICFPW